MFYYFAEIFNVNFLSYITVRAGFAFFFSFVLCVLALPFFIRWAKKTCASQPIYELAPSTHQTKCHTPTMGGVIFVASAVVASLFSAKLDEPFVLISLFVIVSFSLLGFIDDRAKILGASNHAGLSPKQKLAIQCILALITAVLLWVFSGIDAKFYLPLLKNSLFDFSYFSLLFWALVIISASNAVNLTDGLDGLATVPSVLAIFTLGVYAYFMGNAVYSGYLLLPKFAGIGELVIIVSAMIGALLGFLWYNCYPAQVFMGDSGSLSIGAFIGYLGIATKNEILLVLIGVIFVLETLSVILQVGSFKIRKKRIFLMAPLHHHFEIKGWSESKIIVRFWMIALLANIIALILLKIR